MAKKKNHCYDFPRPAVATDIVIFKYLDDDLKIMLIKRKNDPFKGKWALPGGFLEPDETVEDCAARELNEETGLTSSFLQQLGCFSSPDRDPRGRIISIAFYGFARPGDVPAIAADDAKEVSWFSIKSLPELAFDHNLIISGTLADIREKAKLQPLLFLMLPDKFRIGELRGLYEEVCGETFNKKKFRRHMLSTQIIQPMKEKLKGDLKKRRFFRIDRSVLHGFLYNTGG